MTVDEQLAASLYFVEATAFEKQALFDSFGNKVDWQHVSNGTMRTLGQIGNPKKKRAVTVHFTFAKIFGLYICFYEPTSVHIDHNMIAKHIKDKYPSFLVSRMKDDALLVKQPPRICDAINFSNAVSFYKELVKLNDERIKRKGIVTITTYN